MYTSHQRVTRSPLSITPRTDSQPFPNPTRHVSGKGKSVAFIDGPPPPPPPPPLGLLNDNNTTDDGEGLDDWRRFQEAGLLDESVMERKDREALADKAQRLEKETSFNQLCINVLVIDLKKRRLQELETNGSVLQSERQTFIAGREAWENTYSKQKEDLREWERKLQEGEERLSESRRIMNLREEKVIKFEKTVKLKEKELEDEHNKIASSILESKKQEDDINTRLSDLVEKEKEAGLIRKNLEIKEKELLVLNEKLTAKERVEIQKILDEHKISLDSKRREFDLEMDEKRKSIEADMRSKIETVEQKTNELNHKEEKLRKQEQSLDKKSARLNKKEEEIDEKLKSLKKEDKSVKAEAKKLETDKKQLVAERESLEALKATIENIKNEINQQELQVQEEIEKLRITEVERTNYSRLQQELKEEIEKCRLQKELIIKDIEDLRNDRLKFEQEWESLDEKKSALSKEIMEFNEQKENFEKKLKSDEERLEKERLSTKEHIDQQMEAVKLEKETFEARMKHEESLLVEKYENEHRQFLHDFEKKERDLEVSLENKRIEMERNMQEREKAFEEIREKELDNIKYLKEVVRKDFEELKSERERIEKERKEIVSNRQKLEENQLEMQNDINDLGALNKKIKEQREDFVKERNHFIEFVEKLKNCENCGEFVRNYELSDIQIPEVRDDSPITRTINESREKSEGNVANKLKSWVQSTVFKLSPHRKNKQHDESPKTPELETVTNLDAGIDYSNVPAGLEGDVIVRDEQHGLADNLHDEDQSYLGSKNVEVPEVSEQSEMRSGRKKSVRKPKGRPRQTLTVEPVAEENSEKVGRPSTRKRAHAETSLVTGSEMDGESEVQSESVTTGGGGRRKRRQTVAPPPPTPGESRYNLRRHKAEDTAPQAKASTSSRKKKEVSGSKKPETSAAVDTEVSSDVSIPLVHVTVSKRTDTQILETAFKAPEDVADSSGAMKIVKNTEIIEEVQIFNSSHVG
ncbi:hypothetical protein M8C21_033261 [Ambrosia artemisiifolia]|uniref:Nuclear matrix constituent protein 1-like protein n=1 Tax=Ambrosia artemisiifolia TaxID=4212 RepID=A0AAD5BNU3_AMBAR|nr:hypothetical protein M8C21_033261 [Ambrosia artemisiifolia]